MKTNQSYNVDKASITVYVREIGRYVWPPPPPPNYFSPLFFVSNPSSNYLTTLYTIRILSGHCLHSCVYMYPTAQFRLLVIPINSCHKAKIVTKWFQVRPHIILIKWPGNSPDLNPIENVWIWMKSQLREQNKTSIPMLEEAIRKLWEDSEYLEALVKSMPRRMVDVIERDGGMTKY